MLNMIKRLVSEEEGQGMTEYALVLGVIAIGAVAVITIFRDKVKTLWDTIVTEIGKAMPA
ncbi:MAG: Flp family type IVb pilin [Bacillota bacterium]|nr:Flp family type IVb pilin [Bacillota bacterium]